MSDFMDEARQCAAQCWTDDQTSSIEMDVRLAEAVAVRIAGWMDEAARYAKDMEFYRGLLMECVSYLGPNVFVSDDGSIQDEPLLLKVPEMVRAIAPKWPDVSDVAFSWEAFFSAWCPAMDQLSVSLRDSHNGRAIWEVLPVCFGVANLDEITPKKLLSWLKQMRIPTDSPAYKYVERYAK